MAKINLIESTKEFNSAIRNIDVIDRDDLIKLIAKSFKISEAYAYQIYLEFRRNGIFTKSEKDKITIAIKPIHIMRISTCLKKVRDNSSPKKELQVLSIETLLTLRQIEYEGNYSFC